MSELGDLSEFDPDNPLTWPEMDEAKAGDPSGDPAGPGWPDTTLRAAPNVWGAVSTTPPEDSQN